MNDEPLYEPGEAGGSDGDAADPAEPLEPFPWPPREGTGAVAAFAETLRDATFRATRFFRRLPRDGGTAAPIVYYLILGVLVAGVQLFWTTVLQAAGLQEPAPWTAELGAMAPWIDVISFFLSPLILILLLLLASGVTHVLLMLFGGSKRGYERTVQVFCYAYSPQAFAVVPYIGAFVGFVWMVVIAIIGLRDGHQTDGWRAALAVLLPLGAMFGLLFLFGLMLALVELPAG